MKWQEFIEQQKQLPYLKKIDKYLKQHQQDICPKYQDIYRCFNYFDINQTKVVILGQDPYHTNDFANGLAFSVNQDTKNPPPSIVNIFKMLYNDLGYQRTNYDLEDWAKQGVLLLNTSLSVFRNKPLSHTNLGYEQLINNVFVELKKQQHIVFCLWGSYAKKYAKLIDQNKNLILYAPHPSPLSCYRGFIDCKHFSLANNYLTKHNIKNIKW